MMVTTKLTIQDTLPLTCSRTGTCCHGKLVLLNPWELRCLANEKKISTRDFLDLYCDFGGIRLRFDGEVGYKGQQACSQYKDGVGCTAHFGRPLACRLYPLGRQIQSEQAHYMYQGIEFPCLEGCPVVTQLPQMSVGEYLKGQETELFEKAQDAYLELMQNLADIAFELLLDTGLAASGDTKTLLLWRKMGNVSSEELVERIGKEWLDALMLPAISNDITDPIVFVQKHWDFLQSKAQEQFGALQTNKEWHMASVQMMGVALQLARAIGADPKALAELWIDTAKTHGAQE